MPVSQDATDNEVRLDATDIETDLNERLANLRLLAKQLLDELDVESRDRDADGAAAAAAPVKPAEHSRDREPDGATPVDSAIKPAGWLRRLVG